MTKKEKFIQTIKEQFNIELENDKYNIWNKKRNVLYTKLPKHDRNVINYLVKNNIIFNTHLNGYVWIYV